MTAEREAVERAVRRLEREQAYRAQLIAVLRNYLSIGQLDVRLTKPQQAVMVMIANGAGNREIAKVLGISLSGAKHYVSELLRQFGAKDRTHLAARFITSVSEPLAS